MKFGTSRFTFGITGDTHRIGPPVGPDHLPVVAPDKEVISTNQSRQSNKPFLPGSGPLFVRNCGVLPSCAGGARRGCDAQEGAWVAHPLGTLKRGAGLDFFLMRGLAMWRDGLNLMVLGYNFRRMLKELGVAVFRPYYQARREARGIRM